MLNPIAAEFLRSKIAEQKNKIVVVQATKKDGTETEFCFTPSANRSHVAAVVTAKGQEIAAKTQAANPNAMRVWCFRRKRWSQFNLDNVISVAADKKRYVIENGRVVIHG